MMPFRRSCREAAALLVAREDRALAMGDRIALRLHLLACAACPRFERQLLTMRNSLQQWRGYTETEPNTEHGAEKNKN
ncbi:zf-HC2 domain-containing protein [Rhodoferax sp.]|uniref:zf-HC2 domain-containing protein n=1 Tax=Rhodoferax sp. TaxID=50421 RepID=UPI002ACEF2CD|nr:zf-HC2 domain-containing protein [Rhodoferax sp.]MDZ7921398.1 zf-HC2 domain-containing protein [Rhodoferax sp.]